MQKSREHFQALQGRLLILFKQPPDGFLLYLELHNVVEDEADWLRRAAGPWDDVSDTDRALVHAMTLAIRRRLERLFDAFPEASRIEGAADALFEPVDELIDEYARLVSRLSGSEDRPPKVPRHLH